MAPPAGRIRPVRDRWHSRRRSPPPGTRSPATGNAGTSWTTPSCQARLHQPFEGRATAQRIGNGNAEAFAFLVDQPLRSPGVETGGVETDAGAADRRIGPRAQPQ